MAAEKGLKDKVKRRDNSPQISYNPYRKYLHSGRATPLICTADILIIAYFYTCRRHFNDFGVGVGCLCLSFTHWRKRYSKMCKE